MSEAPRDKAVSNKVLITLNAVDSIRAALAGERLRVSTISKS